jgi:hypothetical protein
MNELFIRGLTSRDVWNYENGFYWFSHPSRLAKLLAHYELYKLIVDLPGDVFELGVFKSTSLIRFSTFRQILENAHSRKIVGFDAFGKFPTDNVKSDDDFRFIENFSNNAGDGLKTQEIDLILKAKTFENVELVQGNVFDTLPAYLKKYPSTRLSLLHLDMDVQEPTEYALNLLYDRVVPGGLVIFDDYSTVAGETDAVDIFLTKKGLAIKKLSYNHIPSYIIKPLK